MAATLLRALAAFRCEAKDLCFRATVATGGGGYTSRHKVDQKKFVPTNVIPFPTIYPGYAPVRILNRTAPLGPVYRS